MKKDDFAFAFGGSDLIVPGAGLSLSQFSEFVIVRREQSFRAVFGRVVQIFGYSPGYRQSVEGRGPSANLV